MVTLSAAGALAVFWLARDPGGLWSLRSYKVAPSLPARGARLGTTVAMTGLGRTEGCPTRMA